MTDILDHRARLLSGEEVDLARYRGRVLLIVNTASQCGFTPQYAGLQQLHKDFAERGFSVLAFPCNQFGGQEPGTSDEIASFCDLSWQVSFPVFEKVDVKGANAHPLFRDLTRAKPGLFGSRSIKWNFTKFLVGRDGRPVARFAPQVKPEDLEAPIRKLL